MPTPEKPFLELRPTKTIEYTAEHYLKLKISKNQIRENGEEITIGLEEYRRLRSDANKYQRIYQRRLKKSREVKEKFANMTPKQRSIMMKRINGRWQNYDKKNKVNKGEEQ